MKLLEADMLRKCLCACLLLASARMYAQSSDYAVAADSVVGDTVAAACPEAEKAEADNIVRAEELLAPADSVRLASATDSTAKLAKRDWAAWRPNAKRAMWLALVLPGAGQIYNRKYWKIPIVYGGFVGCIYAMRWNNQMYHDYSQAYLDLMDDDPATESYNEFLHLGATIDDSNLTRYQNLFKKRKDKYRRWRDLSFFCLVGVYALSVIDAYVDASLSEFDISKNLSMRVEPTIMDSRTSASPLRSGTLGVSCSLNF